MTEIAMWLKEINDNKLHHIGEFYTYRYKKPFQKLNGLASAGFKNWWLQQNNNATKDSVKQMGFEIIRDQNSWGFFVQKKSLVVNPEYTDWITDYTCMQSIAKDTLFSPEVRKAAERAVKCIEEIMEQKKIGET